MVSELENQLFKSVYDKTPDYVKNLNLMNFDNQGEFSFLLKKEHLQPYDEIKNPEGLNLREWFANYAKEAKVSTAGIRGPQNILYPQDTRFPINLVGIVLATLAKALVAKEKYQGKNIVKIVGREVRYNSELFLQAIARIQAAQGITTLVPQGTIPIWLASFLAFKMDLLGGEYITSSHGISVKNATKDLNSQGSQYLPEESMEFVNKIEEIFKLAEENGSYEIKISAENNPFINRNLMKSIDDGVDLYVEYLQSGVAKDFNLDLIKDLSQKVSIENVGGSAYKTLSRVLEKLGVSDKFVWYNTEEDAFFHGIGKYDTTPKGEKTFYDYSVDATVLAKKSDGTKFFPVIDTLGYDKKNLELNSVILITDPDHDRLTIVQVEDAGRVSELSKAGIDYIRLSSDKVLTVFTANQAFLMLMDFYAKQLKFQKLWDNHPRFMIKTTASALSWDEWAKNNGVKVVNVPVGFKEIANIMKKVELQLKVNPNEDVIVEDVFSNEINLGKNPRLVFAGEESGGMIMGGEDLIKSQNGRFAVAMREKSATEAIIVASSLISKLQKSNMSLSQYLMKVFEENKIIGRYDTRVDIAYYNESEPDINKLKLAKIEGEKLRTQNDLFYLSIAIGIKENILTLEDAKNILSDAFKTLDFSNLTDIKFVGDGTYMEFSDKYIEIRPSGTDAKTKAYGGGSDKPDIENYASVLGNYSGMRTELHKKFISDEFYENTKTKAMDYYLTFVDKGANNEKFIIPEYSFLLLNC